MPRPSRNIDQTLLHSGRVLFAQHGCAALSVRQVCEHAGVNVGMFHYHFQSKDNYLGQVLQQWYEGVYAQLQARATQAEPSPLQRLRQALVLLAQLVREEGAWVGRIWADAGSGNAVALQFLKRNAPRHLQLLMQLTQDAVDAGELAAMPPLQRFVFMMGSVVAPVLLVPNLLRMDVIPASLALQAPADILSDAAIADRVDRALAALALPLTTAAVPEHALSGEAPHHD